MPLPDGTVVGYPSDFDAKVRAEHGDQLADYIASLNGRDQLLAELEQSVSPELKLRAHITESLTRLRTVRAELRAMSHEHDVLDDINDLDEAEARLRQILADLDEDA